MLAESATCLVQATTSSFHFSVCWRLPLRKIRGAGFGVMPTSGTFWMNVPSVLPGLSPAFVNSLTRYPTVRRSPAVPGARPSNSSDDSMRVCASTAFMSTSGSCASIGPEGTVADVAAGADVAEVAGGGAGVWGEHAAPYKTAPHRAARKVLFITAFL